MTKRVAYCLYRYSRLEGQDGCGVPHVMKPDQSKVVLQAELPKKLAHCARIEAISRLIYNHVVVSLWKATVYPRKAPSGLQ